MCTHVSRMVMVNDDEVAGAMRALFDDTHNVAEGAGAAAVAAILQERDGCAASGWRPCSRVEMWIGGCSPKCWRVR